MIHHPHKPPLRVVTKPHTERNDNTYLEGGLARHTTGAWFWPAMLTLSVFRRLSGLRDCFQPCIPHTHAGYVPASMVLRLSPIVRVGVLALLVGVRLLLLVVVGVRQTARRLGRAV
jgi:hypothetical protein